VLGMSDYLHASSLRAYGDSHGAADSLADRASRRQHQRPEQSSSRDREGFWTQSRARAGDPSTHRHRDRFRDRLGGTYEAVKAS
jgi:hypothetical protein